MKSLSIFACLFLLLAWNGTSSAQEFPYECDDNFQSCGSPEQSGGGGGGGGGGSILINNTDLGDTYQYGDDYDDDGIEDPYDNCPFVANPDQADDDGDGLGSGCDNCPNNFNTAQDDLDGDGAGDACDDDIDNDGYPNGSDVCPQTADPLQNDNDGDGLGDACDDDLDNDGVPNLADNCPQVYNPDQANDEPDIWGDACDDDDDGDGIRNTWDNCLNVANYDQADLDEDGEGDACDADKDDDGIPNAIDNCPAEANSSQEDVDLDGVGDACDDRFCYVVMGDTADCLDPTDPFRVYTPDMAASTGQDVPLRLFANHVNQPIRYTWQILEAPAGSRATIRNPTGEANISTPYEYQYLQGRPVTLLPDEPGTYTLRVVVELEWPDRVTGETGVVAEAFSRLEVDGEPVAACTMADTRRPGRPAWGVFLPFLLAAGALGVRRR